MDTEEYDEELDRSIAYWERSREYRGGGAEETKKFFAQKTVDDFFESVKADLGGEAVDTRSSMNDYMTAGVKNMKLYRERSRWAARMFKRYKEREE